MALVFINRFVPETKGKSHEDFLEQDMEDDSKAGHKLSKPLLSDFE